MGVESAAILFLTGAYSGYEQATLIHDMNQPIPDSWRETASVVFDGGTLDHVFNVTQAFKNSMELVKIGGHFVQLNEANDFLGHAFWQFSPELLFRMFTADNGFEIETVLLHEAESPDRWFGVLDPEVIRSRVQPCNCRPTYILTIEDVPDQSPKNPKYRLAIETWKRLPLPIANTMGPRIARGLP